MIPLKTAKKKKIYPNIYLVGRKAVCVLKENLYMHVLMHAHLLKGS